MALQAVARSRKEKFNNSSVVHSMEFILRFLQKSKVCKGIVYENTSIGCGMMNQTDFSLIEKMNIKTDAIVGNQCDRNSIEEFDVNGKRVVYLNFNEKELG